MHLFNLLFKQDEVLPSSCLYRSLFLSLCFIYFSSVFLHSVSSIVWTYFCCFCLVSFHVFSSFPSVFFLSFSLLWMSLSVSSARVCVLTFDGRFFVGTLFAFDQSTNLVLKKCSEKVLHADAEAEIVPLGLYLLRGDNMYGEEGGEVFNLLLIPLCFYLFILFNGRGFRKIIYWLLLLCW